MHFTIFEGFLAGNWPQTFLDLSLFVLGDVLSSDHHTLDLASTLVNLEDLGVSHQLLHRVLAVEAGTTENLDGLSGVSVGHVGCVGFGDRCIVGVSSTLIWRVI